MGLAIRSLPESSRCTAVENRDKMLSQTWLGKPLALVASLRCPTPTPLWEYVGMYKQAEWGMRMGKPYACGAKEEARAE